MCNCIENKEKGLAVVYMDPMASIFHQEHNGVQVMPILARVNGEDLLVIPVYCAFCGQKLKP